MNAGLANLATLRAWLLPESLATSTDYDAAIAAIGRGVARQLEQECNRGFARVEDDVHECRADRSSVVLPRYPVEQVTDVELRRGGGAWASIGVSCIYQQADEIGLLHFDGTLGTRLDRVRVTYDAGYWFEQEEPDAEEYPTALPEGATPLPDDLLLAWKLQCEYVWAQRDKLGVQVAQPPDAQPPLAQVRLLDVVLAQLRPYRRYDLL